MGETFGPHSPDSNTFHRSSGMECANGHTWSNQFGDDWTPERGTRCDCGRKQWGIPLPVREPVLILAADFVRLALFGQTEDGAWKVGAGGAEDVLAHAKRLMQGALNFSAPPGHGCADCMIDHEACPTCYVAWWKQRHPNVVQIAPQSEALKLAISALPDSETAGPDGTGYKWAWDELTGEEQDWVKDIRRRIEAA
jgi:hypothetical protein